MASFRWVWESDEDGVNIRLIKKRLLGKEEDIAPLGWGAVAENKSLVGIGRVMQLLQECAGTPNPPVSIKGTSLFLRHDIVAGLQENQALGLGLPPSTLLMLGTQSRGDLAQPTFSIQYVWREGSFSTAMGIVPHGSILRQKGIPARIPEPLFSIKTAIDAFNATDTTDDETRFQHLAALKTLIPPDLKTRQKLAVDDYVRNTNILCASSFSLHLWTGQNGFDFDPVLFGRKSTNVWAESDGALSLGEAESLLPDKKQKLFAQYFRNWERCRDRCALENRYYVFIDPGLRAALDVVRKVQKADAETRRTFAKNPQVYLKQALAEQFDESVIERMFIPTEEYSARVIDLGLWQPIVLPWIKRIPNQWLPETFGIMIGDMRVEMNAEGVENARKKIKEAIDNGQETVDIGGGQQISATSETLAVFDDLLGLVKPVTGIPAPNDNTGTSDGNSKHFLIVHENLDTVSLQPTIHRRAALQYSIPFGLNTALKKHQEEGLAWLEECWCVGYPGVLLADDMGLGKSLQALTFLLWLIETRRSLRMPHSPVLIVAPTGLLKNWQDEHEMHLQHPGLGRLLKMYGTETKKLRNVHATKNDIETGSATLDKEQIKAADWILTTYDTLRDYHLSFAPIPFAAIVYDEVQKLKNPVSQWSRAAKAMHAEFIVAMTGTPIENCVEDLWAIMDVAYPNYLLPGKEFSKRYNTSDHDILVELHEKMLGVPPTDADGTRPPVMLRRMKADRLKGLPEKQAHALQKTMPLQQAKDYTNAVAQGRMANTAGAVLSTLHQLRGISLHPILPEQGRNMKDREYIDWSARLALTFEILKEIAVKKEKVLIFLEDLAMQDWLAVMLQRAFHLAKQPMLINGGIPGDKRKQWVDQFQKERGAFDVMILSPKAGGVGLTLTAACHVIHLSRWWNPAVEDQCTDRVYRIGQDKTVHVYYPMAIHPDPDIRESSFDLILDGLLQRKRALCRNVLVPPVSVDDPGALFRATMGASIRVKQQDMQEPVQTLHELDRMTPRQFEEWVLQHLLSQGWKGNRTPVTGDGGADAILTDPAGRTAIFQIKHRENGGRCDAKAIDDLLRARKAYDMPDATLYAVTNGKGFTGSAVEKAERYGIIRISRSDLLPWMGIP